MRRSTCKKLTDKKILKLIIKQLIRRKSSTQNRTTIRNQRHMSALAASRMATLVGSVTERSRWKPPRMVQSSACQNSQKRPHNWENSRPFHTPQQITGVMISVHRLAVTFWRTIVRVVRIVRCPWQPPRRYRLLSQLRIAQVTSHS